jgi:hypothetical protein
MFVRRSLASFLALPLAAGLLALGGCEADSDGTAMLRLDMEGMTGATSLQAGQTFQVSGRAASLATARLYVSRIQLLHEDGRVIDLTDTPVTVRAREASGSEVQHAITNRYVLVKADAGRAPAALGEVPSGSYTGLRFTLGVTGMDNRIAPEDAPAGHPLAVQTPSMHWNWNSGFIFLRMDGQLDINGDGTPDPTIGDPGSEGNGQWRIHLGMEANARVVDINTPFELEADEMQDLHLQVDFARFAQGIDYGVAANRFCMTGGCPTVVSAVTGNIASAFSLHGVHHDH